jgi:hypothetical protein
MIKAKNIQVHPPLLTPYLSKHEKRGFGWTGHSSIPLPHSTIELKQKLQILTHLISKNEHPAAGITSTTLIIDFRKNQFMRIKGEKRWPV